MENTYIASFVSSFYRKITWQGNKNKTIEIAFQTVRILSSLIRVEELTVGTTKYDQWGQKGQISYENVMIDNLSERSENLAIITAQNNLKLRIAIPSDCQIQSRWQIMDSDIKIRLANFTSTENIGKNITGWLNPKVPIGIGYEVEIKELGEIEVIVRDGVFKHDSRSREFPVLGSSLNNWIVCENSMQDHVFGQLREIGFHIEN
ncbi:MAG: hypothetical protein JXR53_08455 [Bacteroidales bacterium]|nr:hypothetical protein [Bacteroidales bacterium]